MCKELNESNMVWYEDPKRCRCCGSILFSDDPWKKTLSVPDCPERWVHFVIHDREKFQRKEDEDGTIALFVRYRDGWYQFMKPPSILDLGSMPVFYRLAKDDFTIVNFHPGGIMNNSINALGIGVNL